LQDEQIKIIWTNKLIEEFIYLVEVRENIWNISVLFVFHARAWVAQWVRSLDYLTTKTSLSPIWHGFAPGFVNYKKGCTRLVATSDKAYQLLVHGWWFSLGTPASSTTKTGGFHDIAEILLKVALNTKNQWINQCTSCSSS
jgi:hypothetical protein